MFSWFDSLANIISSNLKEEKTNVVWFFSSFTNTEWAYIWTGLTGLHTETTRVHYCLVCWDYIVISFSGKKISNKKTIQQKIFEILIKYLSFDSNLEVYWGTLKGFLRKNWNKLALGMAVVSYYLYSYSYSIHKWTLVDFTK